MECRHKFTMCRLCLGESESFNDIFQLNELFGYVAAEVITDLLHFEVSETDGYPHVICSICLEKLTDFKQFKVQCQNSRDTYDNVFASDECHPEHPIDIVPSEFMKTELDEGTNDVDTATEVFLNPAYSQEEDSITDKNQVVESTVKLEPIDPVDSQEAQQEVVESTVKLEPIDPVDSQAAQQEVVESTVKLEPIDPVDSQDVQQDIRKCNVACTSLEYLSCHPKRTCCESYGPYESSVEDNGKPSLKGWNKVAFDANPGENDKSSGSANANVGEMDVKVRRDCKSPTESIEMLPVRQSDVESMETSVEELRREMIERRKDVNCVDTGVDESDSDADGANENEIKGECFRCNKYGMDFEKKDLLIRHLELHGYEVDKESCSEDGDIQVHNNVCSGSKSNKNEVHKKGLKGKMSDIVKRDEGVKKYVCDTCGKGFNWVSGLKRHLRLHTGEKPFACAVCGKRCSNKWNLRKHEFIHTGEKPYMCETCGKGFAEHGDLKRHIQTHNGEKSYECEICGKKLAYSNSLTIHRRIHSKERPFICEVCGKGFIHNKSLKQHRQIHSDEKPYECEICSKKFTQNVSLKNHIRSHTGERPYACKICNKCFRDSCTLSRHLKIHSQKTT